LQSMNFTSHFSFGIFTGLLTYYVTQDLTAALIMFFVQIGLILDFLLNKTIKFEPFHSVAAMLVVWLVSFFLFPAYHWYVLIAYFTHLFLDIFVDEEIPLLWPTKYKLMYPIKNSERRTIIGSWIGTIVVVVLLVL